MSVKVFHTTAYNLAKIVYFSIIANFNHQLSLLSLETYHYLPYHTFIPYKRKKEVKAGTSSVSASLLLFQTRCRFDCAALRAQSPLWEDMIHYDTTIPLDRQWIIAGYNVPPFCGITGVFENYYGMAVSHKSQNHNTLTYHNGS